MSLAAVCCTVGPRPSVETFRVKYSHALHRLAVSILTMLKPATSYIFGLSQTIAITYMNFENGRSSPLKMQHVIYLLYLIIKNYHNVSSDIKETC